MGKIRKVYKILVEEPEERKNLGNLSINERIILKRILTN
jgi:hypothetical protein